MPDHDLNTLVRRLDSIERLLQKAVFLDDLISPVDPAPDDLVRAKGSIVRQRLQEILKVNPGWFSDPSPEDFLNVRVLDLIRRYRGGFTDPAPDDLANVRLKDLLQRIPGGGFTDPSPEDISRLTLTEVESQLHKVNTEAVRLKSIERLLSGRLQELRGTGK